MDHPKPFPGPSSHVLVALGGVAAATPLPPLPWHDVIAVDSGGDLLMRLGQPARLVIGDLDSISPAALAFHQAAGATIRRFPPDKDQTDFELALAALPVDASAMVHLCGFWGGRLDHALMNLLVLRHFTDRGLFTFDTDTASTADADEAGLGCGGVLGPGRLRLTLPVGTPVALLALDDCRGLDSTGVRWPLTGATLAHGEARGISNVTTAPIWELGVTEGCLVWLVRGLARAAVGIEWRCAASPRPGPAATPPGRAAR